MPGFKQSPSLRTLDGKNSLLWYYLTTNQQEFVESQLRCFNKLENIHRPPPPKLTSTPTGRIVNIWMARFAGYNTAFVLLPWL